MKQPSIEKLKKFFTLEAERKYDNKAVIGGLMNMLSEWEAEARADNLPESIIQAVTTRLRDYHRLSPDSRRDTLKGLWNRIRREFGIKTDSPETATETKSKAQSSPAPVKGKPAERPKKEKPKKKPAKPIQEEKPKREIPEGPPAALEAPVTVLDGVGPKNAEKLSKLGISNLGGMLYHFPRRYDDYSQLKPINRLRHGEEVTVIGNIQSVNTRPIRGGKSKILEVIINDGSGALRINWFNQPWLSKNFYEDANVVVSGKIDQYLGRFVMSNPEWELLDEKNLHTNRIVPVYPLTAKLTQRWLRTQMDKVVNYWALRVKDPFPQSLLKKTDLFTLPEALLQVHFPDSLEDLKAAQMRLAFDEIFYLQLGVLRQKQEWNKLEGSKFVVSDEWMESQNNRLPYELTNAQKKAVNDIRKDMQSGTPMNRLLQGDVGSGKTAVAGLAAALVIENQAQVAVLAPTSILAEQHFTNFSNFLADEGKLIEESQIRLLIGATPEKEKQEIRSLLENGEVKILIGTHALLEDPVIFQNLKFAVIDEQHRFGVDQRAALRQKGENPHLLVMTATPIPRSLALTIYGDLDLTVMDEMPPGRQPVETHVLPPRERERAYSLIHKHLEEGHQAFVVYPLVEESDKSDSKAAVEEHQRLKDEVFHKYEIGLLHGRMHPKEKENEMAKFRDQETQILVSTSVVEVGVDVPNATIMVIEGANRFGLAQLHQFRGRVGRGGDKAYCLLIPENEGGVENERLAVMAETTDGFLLAEKDLNQRGPGQFLGTRQSGFAELQLTNISNIRLIEKARNHAHQLLEEDPQLEKPENQMILEDLNRLWNLGQGDIS